MGFSFFDWLFGVGEKKEATKSVTVDGVVFNDLLNEYMVRELAFNTCVDMIANAIGKCEFKTYQNRKEVKEREYYLWNIEPNTNQNSTAFIHKLIYQLYRNNEALIISTKKRDGTEMLVVADAFVTPEEYPQKMQEYTGVVVGQVEYNKTFKENEVIHLVLNNKDIKPVLDGLYGSYIKLVQAAMKNYSWASGKHLKAHVNQIAQGGTVDANGNEQDWNAVFTEMLNKQVKPFLQGENGVLPEFDGYQYTDIGGNPDANRTTRDIRALVDDIFDFTARAFCIPPVLLFGDVAGTQDAMTRWLTTCIDPLRDQLQEEITRKRYGYENWVKGTYIAIDTSAIIHFDMFSNAQNIEKLIGSGAYTINDILIATGREEINEAWANKHFMTLNISGIEEVTRSIDGKGGE